MMVRETVLGPASTETLVHETYAAHWMVTNLGIDTSEVMVLVQRVANVLPLGTLCVLVSIQRGYLTCNIPVSPLASVEEGKRFHAAWLRFAEQQPKMAGKELDRICKGTVMWRRRAEVIEALILKGFELAPGVLQ